MVAGGMVLTPVWSVPAPPSTAAEPAAPLGARARVSQSCCSCSRPRPTRKVLDEPYQGCPEGSSRTSPRSTLPTTHPWATRGRSATSPRSEWPRPAGAAPRVVLGVRLQRGVVEALVAVHLGEVWHAIRNLAEAFQRVAGDAQGAPPEGAIRLAAHDRLGSVGADGRCTERHQVDVQVLPEVDDLPGGAVEAWWAEVEGTTMFCALHTP